MEQLGLALAPLQRDSSPAPRARRRDPATSHNAAKLARAVAPNHRNLIMAKLVGRMDAYDLAAATGLSQVQVCRRLPELHAQGLARPTDEVRGGSRLWERC